MGASEILKILEKSELLTALDISKKTRCSVVAVRHSLKRLVKDISEDVKVRLMTLEEKQQKYGRKLGKKIYIYWIDLK